MTEWNCYCPVGNCHEEIVDADPKNATLRLMQHMLETHETRFWYADVRPWVKVKAAEVAAMPKDQTPMPKGTS